MALLIAMELGTLLFSIKTLSSVRAYVGAEGLWSKAQKNAAYSLQKYGRSKDENDFQAYKNYLSVPIGDSKGRRELAKANPDLDIARQGYLQGRFHADDVDGAIKLFLRFHNIYYIHKAIIIWGEGDSLMSGMMAIGNELHAEISSGASSPEKVNEILNRLDVVNQQLTVLEDDFSFTLGEGSRWLTNLVLKLLLSLVLTVEFCGLSITILVSRGITVGLKNINSSAEKIAYGDYTSRATVFSRDEIGTLANAFNSMTEKLQRNITALTDAETERSKMIADIVQRNNNLEQFSYIVSHNLRAPVANILGLTDIMENSPIDKEEEKAILEYLVTSAKKLDEVIRDINYILELKENVNEKKVSVQFAEIIADIKISMAQIIEAEQVQIITDFEAVPEILTIKSYLYSIFYNLISNSIKYRQPGVAPVIRITATRIKNKIRISLKDNGLGINIEKKGRDVFGLYKRFHNHVEGKGMGLFMVKTEVEALGGTINLVSEENKGTEFIIKFGIEGVEGYELVAK